MAKKTLQIRGLRQRWMLNTIMPVLVLVILAVCLFSASITSYYYTSMESTLKAQARSDAESFNSYSMDSYGEYYQAANLLVENFADKDVLELQFINTSGRIQLSSYGLTTGNSPAPPTSPTPWRPARSSPSGAATPRRGRTSWPSPAR